MAGSPSYPNSTCVGTCTSTPTQTSSGTTLNTSTASSITTSIPTATGTSTATASNPFAFTVGPEGYVTSGTWKGYAWTGTESPSLGSTVAPADFSTLAGGERLCAQGSVAPSWSAVGLLGLNVNQSRNGGASVWTPDSNGIAYDVTNTGGSQLRMQIQGAAGWPSEAWCAIVSGTSGTIYWSQFNSACWDGSGSIYDRTPLQNVMILVPGSNIYTVPFNVCLNSIGPI